MVNWECPHCSKSMHSSWEASDIEKVICIHCGKAFINPYYKRNVTSQDSCQKSNVIDKNKKLMYKGGMTLG
jgi:Zn ribbon nucleic-acid-binding protein